MARIYTSSLINSLHGRLSGSVFSKIRGNNIIYSNKRGGYKCKSQKQFSMRGIRSTISGKWFNLSEEVKSLWRSYSLFNKVSNSGYHNFLNLNTRLYYLLGQNNLINYPPITPCTAKHVSGISGAFLQSGAVSVSWVLPVCSSNFIFCNYRPVLSHYKMNLKNWKFGFTSDSININKNFDTCYESDRLVDFKLRSFDKCGRVSPWSNVYRVVEAAVIPPSGSEYIYAGGSAVFDHWISRYKTTDLSFVDHSILYSSYIYAMAVDTDHIYVGGEFPYIWPIPPEGNHNRIYKYRKSDLVKVAESPFYDGDIVSIAIDDEHIYVAGHATGNAVRKYLKSDLSLVATSGNYGGGLHAVAVDAEYVYAGGATIHRVFKYRKSDLVKIGQSVVLGSTQAIIYVITIDTDYIYAGDISGTNNYRIYKCRKSDVGLVGAYIYENSVRALAEDGDYLYAGGSIGKVYKYDKSSRIKIAESLSYGDIIDVLVVDHNNDFIYAGGFVDKIFKYKKLDLVKITESPTYGADIYALGLS